MKLDLTSLQQVREFAAKYKSKGYPLHYLINNAGIYAAQREETQDGFESHMGVNYLSPWVLTWELLDVLKSSAPSRVVNVSSFGFLQSTQLRHFSNFSSLQ
jgi:retinol dehydrogenase 12